jgi:hypothetical protein
MLDNGAYSTWKAGKKTDLNFRLKFYRWAIPILNRVPQAIAVIPDIIEGSWQENLAAVDEIIDHFSDYPDAKARLWPVWHYNEPLELLDTYARAYGFGTIAFGACGRWADVGSEIWRHRTREAFDRLTAIHEEDGSPIPRAHLLRGLSQLKQTEFAFTSGDSTNIGQNHAVRTKEGKETAPEMRDRIERDRFPEMDGYRWPHQAITPTTRIISMPRPTQPEIFGIAELV